ncbi:MAG TPA: DUF6794 domain-containing protein [Longimicrobiales bacterium]
MLERQPCNVCEAVAILRRLLRPDELSVLKKSKPADLARFHFNHGEYIRNLWVHRGGSPLTKRIDDAGGCVGNGDDFSQLIIEALWHDLNDRPFDLKASAHYQRIVRADDMALAEQLWASDEG